jgi:hypothetical protein
VAPCMSTTSNKSQPLYYPLKGSSVAKQFQVVSPSGANDSKIHSTQAGISAPVAVAKGSLGRPSIDDDPVVVDPSDHSTTSDDEKSLLKPRLLSESSSLGMSAAMHQMMQRHLRSKHSRSTRSNEQWNYTPFRADLVERLSPAGVTATFFAPVKPLLPNNSTNVTEAAQFATLFDEQRCIGVTVHNRCAANLQVIQGAWALVFDVANSGAYTSVAGTLVTGQRMGPVSLNFGYGTVPETNTGYHIRRFHTLNSLPPTTANPELVGGSWFASTDSNAVVGYLKYAADAISGGAVQFDTFIVYHMEYRERT